jgi:hypothetical protein
VGFRGGFPNPSGFEGGGNSAQGSFGRGGLVIGGQIPTCLDAFTVANVVNNTAASDPNIEGSYTIC